MNKVLLFLICFFCTRFTIAQTFKLYETPLEHDEQGISRYPFAATALNAENSSEAILPVANGIDFYYSSIAYQHAKNGVSNLVLNAIYGSNKRGNVYMIFDKNQNNNFTDDSVYIIPNAFYANNDWKVYQNIPLIVVDSLKYLKKDSTRGTMKVSFRACPFNLPLTAPAPNDRFKSSFFTVFSANYYRATLMADSNYEFRLSKFPINAAFDQLDSVPNYPTTDNYWVFIKKRQGDDSIFSHVCHGLLGNLYYDSLLTIRNHSFKIYSNDHFSKSVYLTELKAIDVGIRKPLIEKKVYPFSFNAFLVNKTHSSTYQFSSSKLTLLYFTGSWCVPCEMAFKDVVNFYKKYTGKIKVVAIDKEKDQNASLKYFNHKKIKWDLYYEQLNDASPESIGKKFSVFTYPHYFLINEKSEVLKETFGDGGIQPIIDFLGGSDK